MSALDSSYGIILPFGQKIEQNLHQRIKVNWHLHTERVALKLKHWSLNLLAGPLIMIYINKMVLIFHTYIGLKTIFL